jgi:hypothetical protein
LWISFTFAFPKNGLVLFLSASASHLAIVPQTESLRTKLARVHKIRPGIGNGFRVADNFVNGSLKNISGFCSGVPRQVGK